MHSATTFVLKLLRDLLVSKFAFKLNCTARYVEGSEFRCSDQTTIQAFRRRLADGGAMCTIRQSRGDEEMAACGQLGSPDSPEDWKPAPPRLKKPKRLREVEVAMAAEAAENKGAAAA